MRMTVGERTFMVPYRPLFRMVLKAIEDSGYEVREKDVETGLITAVGSTSLIFGGYLEVILYRDKDGVTLTAFLETSSLMMEESARSAVRSLMTEIGKKASKVHRKNKASGTFEDPDTGIPDTEKLGGPKARMSARWKKDEKMISSFDAAFVGAMFMTLFALYTIFIVPLTSCCTGWFIGFLMLMQFGFISTVHTRYPKRKRMVFAVLMVVMLVSGGLVYAWGQENLEDPTFGFVPTGRKAPRMEFNITADNGTYNITLIYTSSINRDGDYKWYLMTNRRAWVAYGDLDEIRIEDIPKDPEYQINYYDADNDSHYTVGDYIRVNSTSVGGFAEEHYRFRLIFKPSGDSITDMAFPNEGDIISYYWNFTTAMERTAINASLDLNYSSILNMSRDAESGGGSYNFIDRVLMDSENASFEKALADTSSANVHRYQFTATCRYYENATLRIDDVDWRLRNGTSNISGDHEVWNPFHRTYKTTYIVRTGPNGTSVLKADDRIYADFFIKRNYSSCYVVIMTMDYSTSGPLNTGGGTAGHQVLFLDEAMSPKIMIFDTGYRFVA